VNAVAEVRWFLVNYALLNAYCFALGVIQGIVLLASYAGTIPGYGGSQVEQIFWYAIGVVFYWPLVFGIPVLLVALLVWRLAIRLVGRPRLTAYLVATVLVVAAAIRIERTEPPYLAIVLVAVLGYATIVRLPPRAPMPQAA
jgi:hypothetical protein